MSADVSPMQSRLLALAALSMGFSLISSAFGFYYVKVFLNYFHIQESWFQFAQTLYMVWNAVNDPLFAYLQDSTNFTFTRTRRESVLYAAPFFAISFIVPWFPWGSTDGSQPWLTGLHLIVALCFWDTMFTYVGLAYCCFFTEMSKDTDVRLQMIKYSQIGHLIGSLSVSVLQHFSSQLEDFTMFQFLSVIIAVLSCLLMMYAGKHGHTETDLKKQVKQQKGEHVEEKYQKYSYITLTKQVLFNRDFLSFVSCNFLQEFHRSFLGGFLAIFCDQLISKAVISDFTRTSFYGGSRTVPQFTTLLSDNFHQLLSEANVYVLRQFSKEGHNFYAFLLAVLGVEYFREEIQILVIAGTPIVSRLGYFKVIQYSFIWKIIASAVFFCIGSASIWLLMVFLLLDSTFASAAYNFYNMPLSDIADNDTERYNRKHPVTSMVFGTNALVVKPAISLAPMVVVSILNRYGYEQLQKKTLTDTQIESLNNVMFTLIWCIPLIIGVFQSYFWSFYTIRESKNMNMSINIDVNLEEP